MGIISVLLIVIFIITAILLVVVVLIQDEQGEGLGGLFGGGSSTPFGSRSGNVLTRFTSILGAVFLFCSFGIAWVNRTPQSGDVLGAAKREEAQTAKEWWLTPVNSNAKLPSDLTSGTSGTSLPSSSETPAGAQPAATPLSSAAPNTPVTGSTAPAQPDLPVAPPASASGGNGLAQ